MEGIIFTKLFGRFDYNIKFNENGLTILTGPNGFGKSTILKSIDAIKNKIDGLKFFLSIDFERISFNFSEGETLEIKKNKNGILVEGIEINNFDLRKFNRSRSLPMHHRFYRMNIDCYIDRISGEELSREEYQERIEKNFDNFDYEGKLPDRMDKISKIFDKFSNLLGNIFYIEEQRLIIINSKSNQEYENIDVISELPNKFKNIMKDVSSDYSNTSNDLDSSFPFRIMQNNDFITEEDYKEKISDMNRKYDKLNYYDISMKTTQNSMPLFDRNFSKVFKVYFDDFNSKYSVYEDLINKLDLFTSIINNRLNFKEVKISRDEGFSVVDENTKKLDIKRLSSGEKQEIVLFYKLIFETEEKMLLLIDEPEISLHVAWQKKFMDDLEKIISYKKISVIVATHSPQIISNYWEYQIDLGEMYGKELN